MESAIEAGSGLSKEDEAHIWRSKFINKSAKCEAELRRLLKMAPTSRLHFKVMAENLLSSQKDANAKNSKGNNLKNLLEELIPLIELRAELAHSIFIDGQHQDGSILLKNANFAHAHFDKLTFISADMRKKTYDRLSWIVGQLASITLD